MVPRRWTISGTRSPVAGEGKLGGGDVGASPSSTLSSAEISCLSKVSRSEMSLGRERESYRFITVFTFFLSVFFDFLFFTPRLRWIGIAGLITQKNSLE